MTVGTAFFGARVSNLDAYTTNLKLAYHRKRLRSAYAGSAFKGRESGGNTEQDIGFASNGDEDRAALATFGGVNNVVVGPWYDQSATGNNLTQATTTKRPKIYSAGVNLGRVEFDDSDDQLATASTLGSLSKFTIFCPGYLFGTSPGNLDFAWYFADGTPYVYCAYETGAPNIVVSDDVRAVRWSANASTTDGWAFRYDSTASGLTNQVKAYRNGAAVTALNSTGSGSFAAVGTGNTLWLAGTPGGTLIGGARLKGLVLYDDALSDADIAAIHVIVNE